MTTPHSRFEHVFALVRFDDFGDIEVSEDQRVTITKVFFDESAARREADRLNSAAPSSARYVVQLTRLVPRGEPGD